MKKLNKSELQILAKRIQDKIELTAKEDQKRLDIESDAANLKTAKKILEGIGSFKSHVKSYDKKTRDYLSKYYASMKRKATLDSILVDLRTAKTKIKIPGGTTWISGCYISTEIMDNLIINQIDCADLNELTTNVTRKYLNAK